MDFKKVGLMCAAVFVALFAPAVAVQAESAQIPVPAQTGKPGDAAVRPSYVIGPDDQLVIHALDLPDLSERTQRVDSGGDLRLPMVGRIHVAGLTVEQLEAELTTRLKAYLEQPDVSVTVTEFKSQPVSVIGAVRSPGVQQIGGYKTLIEVLTMAGGLSDDAGPTLKLTRRRESGVIPLPEATTDPTGNFSVVEIDARALLSARNFDKNIIVQAYDMISVPRAETVYVLGEVGKAGPLLLTNGNSMTVMQALSASGGALRTSKPAKASILRAVPGQQMTEIPVDIQKIMQGISKDVTLQAGDILMVPDDSGKRATSRVLAGIAQVGMAVATYGIIR